MFLTELAMYIIRKDFKNKKGHKQGDQIGRLFTMRSFLKITQVAILAALFYG
jgi:hypothetical protein